jgi:hypothetical protein
MLLYLAKDPNGESIILKNRFMIARDCDLGAIPTTYDWMESDWRKAGVISCALGHLIPKTYL